MVSAMEIINKPTKMGRNTQLAKTLHVNGQDKEKFLDLTGKAGHITPMNDA